MNVYTAIGALVVVTVITSFCADYLVGAIDEFAQTYSIPKAFIGLILLPIVGNAAGALEKPCSSNVPFTHVMSFPNRTRDEVSCAAAGLASQEILTRSTCVRSQCLDGRQGQDGAYHRSCYWLLHPGASWRIASRGRRIRQKLTARGLRRSLSVSSRRSSSSAGSSTRT